MLNSYAQESKEPRNVQTVSLNQPFKPPFFQEVIMKSSFSELDKKLIERALAATNKSYAPYSNFHVGSAVLTAQGNIYIGCNVENASYGVANCAERTAIFSAVASEGPNMRIKTIVALCLNNDGILMDGCSCGLCRQVISEFSLPDTRIIYQFNGKLISKTIDQLLPDAFSKANLEKNPS